MKRQSSIREDIVKSQNAIRQKYKKLKLQDVANEEHLKQTFRPLTESLNTMIKNNVAVQNMAKLINKKGKKDFSSNTEEYMDTDNNKEDEHHDTDTENNGNEEEEILKSPPKNERNKIDSILEQFFDLHDDQKNHSSLDRVYGIRSDGKRWLLGDSPIEAENDIIKIKDKSFRGSQGLYELLFLKNPDSKFYNAKDLDTYKEMLLLTNAHKQRYESTKQVNSNRGTKYMNIIKGLVQNTAGSGIKINSGERNKRTANLNNTVNLNSVRYEYWDDPNELVERLRILVASKEAGNTGLNNEIISIKEELREAGIIE
jgi:hypothetical protein